jgi:hypothetical protein
MEPGSPAQGGEACGGDGLDRLLQAQQQQQKTTTTPPILLLLLWLLLRLLLLRSGVESRKLYRFASGYCFDLLMEFESGVGDAT